MKTLIYGAGVTGSLCAARLSQSGQDVTLLARGHRATWLRKNDIVMEDLNSGARTVTHLRIVERLDPEDLYDLIIVHLPKDHVSDALPHLAANAHIANILFMGNNVAGPDEYVGALGRQRVLLGFPSGAGSMAEGVVHFADTHQGRTLPVHIGELDGKTSPRLSCISAIFCRAGIPVLIESNMAAWLRSHAAIILPLASALYMADGDPFRLARTRDGLVLVARALREASHVLDILGVPLTPPWLRLFARAPEPLLVALLRQSLQHPLTQIGLSHAEASRGEMEQLATEFSALAGRASYATPVMDYLYSFVNPQIPPMADGSAQLGINWRDTWIALGLVAGGIAALRLLRWARRRRRA